MSAKIGLLRGHAEKTSTNARNRQIKLRKLHEAAEDGDHQLSECTNQRKTTITHAATAQTSGEPRSPAR
jgi:hypothetical protein